MLKSPLSTPPTPLFPPRGKKQKTERKKEGNKTKTKKKGGRAPAEAPIIT